MSVNPLPIAFWCPDHLFLCHALLSKGGVVLVREARFLLTSEDLGEEGAETLEGAMELEEGAETSEGATEEVEEGADLTAATEGMGVRGEGIGVGVAIRGVAMVLLTEVVEDIIHSIYSVGAS